MIGYKKLGDKWVVYCINDNVFEIWSTWGVEAAARCELAALTFEE